MTAHAARTLAVTFLATLAGMPGCEEDQTPTKPDTRERHTQTSDRGEPEAAPQHSAERDETPAVAASHDKPADDGNTIEMEGIVMVAPEGWVAQPIQPGPMSPEHVFALPEAEGDAEPGEVRITHFPNMKGMDEANIQRWIAQVKRPDGSSYTRDEVEASVTDSGHVRLTQVDLSGIVQATMRANPKPNHRMIAAIVDHPKGPHFVVAAGPVNTIEKWEEPIRAFLNSATVE